jgi:hypothetical protein
LFWCSKEEFPIFLLYLLPSPALKTLYFSLFHCHLAYCPIILSISSQSNINKVSLLQRKAIRTITNSNYNDHANPLFHQLNILPFDKVILFSKLMFMHAIKYNYCLESFSNIWQTNAQCNPAFALRNADDFALPIVQREIFRKSPLYSLPTAWNSLGDVKLQPNRCTFKIALQYELIESLTNKPPLLFPSSLLNFLTNSPYFPIPVIPHTSTSLSPPIPIMHYCTLAVDTGLGSLGVFPVHLNF